MSNFPHTSPPGAPAPAPVPPVPSDAAASSGGQEQQQQPQDWRKSVPHSYRTSEVRAIADVLASVEPGASRASKFMLATRFEDTIFQSASSLADYRKRLTKRLKKYLSTVQKPPQPTAAATGGGAGGQETEVSASQQRQNEMKIESELRSKYGESLLFIIRHATEAIKLMSEKHGLEKGNQLRQHVENAEQWAVEIGLFDNNKNADLNVKRQRRIPREIGYLDRLRGHLQERVENIKSHVVKLTHPDLFLQETLIKLENSMTRDVVGGHKKAELTCEMLASVTKDILFRALGQTTPPVQNGYELRKLIEKVTAATTATTSAAAATTAAAASSLPMMNVVRNKQKIQEEIKETNLKHLEKIRLAAQCLIGYMSLNAEGKAEARAAAATTAAGSVAPPMGGDEGGILKKIHSTAVDSINHIINTFHDDDNDDDDDDEMDGDKKKKTKAVTLEDAWMKFMEYGDEGGNASGGTAAAATTVEGDNTDGGTTTTGESKHDLDDASSAASSVVSTTSSLSGKRLKTHHTPSSSQGNVIVLRTRVLLTPGRKTPFNLLPALRMKQATLIRYGGNDGPGGSIIQMMFGTAFVMTVYFAPLLVTIRALPPSSSLESTKKEGSDGSSGGREGDENEADKTSTRDGIAPSPHGGGIMSKRMEEEGDDRHLLPKWTSARFNLDKYDGGGGLDGTTDVNRRMGGWVPPHPGGGGGGVPSNTIVGSSTNQKKLQVLGVEGAYANLGPIVASKLEYASARATRVLRRCFADVAGRCYKSMAMSDFEVEISEATALLKFLQIARETYMPGWQDEGV